MVFSVHSERQWVYPCLYYTGTIMNIYTVAKSGFVVSQMEIYTQCTQMEKAEIQYFCLETMIHKLLVYLKLTLLEPACV